MTATSTREQVPKIVPAGAASPEPRPAPAPKAGAPQSSSGLTGRDILQILRKRKWFILFWVVLFTVLTAVATLVWAMYAPLYTAEALLEVTPPKASQLTASRDLYGKDIMDRLTGMAADMVKSTAVLDDALKSQEVKKTAWYRETRADRAIQELAEALRVSPEPNKNFVRIRMTGSNKKDLPEIVNAVAEAAERDSQKAQSKTHEKTMLRLQAERRKIEDKLRQVRKDAVDARPTDIPNIEDNVNILKMKLQTLTTLITQLEAANAQALAALEAAKMKYKNGTLQKSPEILAVRETDPRLRSMQVAEINLATEYDNLLRKFGNNHRLVQDVKARLESVRKKIHVETDKLIKEQAEYLLGDLEANYTAMNNQLREIREKLNETTATARERESNLATLKRLGAEEEALNENLRKIKNALLELSLLEGSQATVRLRKQADEPREPSWPKWRVMMPLGVVLGLIVGFGLTFLLEFIDTSIKGPSDMTRRVDLPLLGMIPHSDDLEEKIPDMRKAFLTSPNSLVSEAFRQIRTRLLFSGPASQRRALMVTSAMPQDGRTTVVLNLAASIAGGGRKILVVDANFRQPAIHKLFPECPSDGLSNALVGQAPWHSLVREIHPDLFAMASGPLPPNPAELLGSDPMREMIGEMTERYDQVIFDAAPCLVVADAPVLATLIDGVLVVVRAGANTYGVVQKVNSMLRGVGTQMIGAVLNGLRVTAGGYLRKNYDTFYEYQEKLDQPEAAGK